MKYDSELKKAEEFENQGKHLQAAKIFEEIGRKCMRESGIERSEAPRIIAKSIAHYLLAEKKEHARDLAFQAVFMKEEHPLLSIQIEAAIASKKKIVRIFETSSIPKKITEDDPLFRKIPENRKMLKETTEITIKRFWEGTLSGKFEEKYDLLEQKHANIQELINFILATKTGVNVIGAEMANGKKVLVLTAVTFNENPVEIIQL
ncbi:MAG: hypothetical protein ACTSXO_10585 [Candidatus Heimdallarchaeota archaeon]|nr:MAG: hypothetical protein DRP02_10065 [Candidatus Gerdarchaeota archaeon]